MDFQIPQAVISLKQGVGRLIRDVNDYGVVMIGDPRITQKFYGRVFLNSLPDMPVTSDVKDVETFYQHVSAADVAAESLDASEEKSSETNTADTLQRA
jgi:ATP-dependent DNA helicase DinG